MRGGAVRRASPPGRAPATRRWTFGGFLATYALAFAAYLAALRVVGGPRAAAGSRLALGLALVWRVALVCAPPLLSDDVYRYVWEGRIQLHGGNPYAWEDRPEGARWAPLRDDVWRGVTHKFYSALYPPAWQMAARAVVWLHDSVTAMKAFLVACELGALALLARDPAAPRPAAGAPPRPGLEPAGAGRDRGQRAQRRVRDPARRWRRWPRWRRGRPLLAAVAGAVAFAGQDPARARRGRVGAALSAGGTSRWPGWSPPRWSSRTPPRAPGLWHSATRYARYWRFNETLFAAAARA